MSSVSISMGRRHFSLVFFFLVCLLLFLFYFLYIFFFVGPTTIKVCVKVLNIKADLHSNASASYECAALSALHPPTNTLWSAFQPCVKCQLPIHSSAWRVGDGKKAWSSTSGAPAPEYDSIRPVRRRIHLDQLGFRLVCSARPLSDRFQTGPPSS